MKWIQNCRKMNFLFMIGLLLINLAIIIWAFSIFELRSNELILTDQVSSLEELWNAEAALEWWKKTYSTKIIPTTFILFFSGIGIVLSSMIYYNFEQKVTINQLNKKLQEIHE